MKTKSGQITFEADTSKLFKRSVYEDTAKKATEYIYEELVKTVKLKLALILVPENFMGDAEDHIFKNGFEHTKELVEKYSLAIYIDFFSNINNLLTYNKKTNTIEISSLIWALEYGDFYKPALHIFSKELRELAKTAEDSIRAIGK